jgi:hypothetical protein
MPEPTKADLRAAVAKLTEENAALYDIFAAAREASGPGADVHYLFGYVSGIGSQPWEHGNVPVLRTFAEALRLKGREAAAPVITGSGGEVHRWPVTAITGAGRACPCCTDDPLNSGDCNCREDCGVTRCQAADPGHEDTDGETWRTDGAAEPERGLASCGHPANEDGECDCSSWPERAVMAS